jgi:hypothetical protein
MAVQARFPEGPELRVVWARRSAVVAQAAGQR